MTSTQWVRRVVKPAAFVAALVPAVLLVRDTFTGNLGANPVEALTHRTGFWGLTLLTVSLAVTPLRRLTGVGALVHLRRMLGLFAFTYAALHFTVYALDRSIWSGEGWAMGAIVEDVVERPYITVGFAVFLILSSLAVTSTNGWVRRLGGRRWQALHRLVYVAALGGVLHFLWLVKADILRPAIFGAIVVGLLAVRLPRRKRRSGPRPEATPG
jgi:sulfoxide reductase heme-binding subunit YedZ